MKQEQENVVAHDPPSQKQPAQARATKPAKNYYEPYVTPPILYAMVRWLLVEPVFRLAARLHVSGQENLPASGPFIIAANHLAWADIPLIARFVMKRKLIYMAKEEYFKGRMFWVVRFLGSFPVKRGEADRQALHTAQEQLKKGNILAIFPEGTRSRTHKMAQAHPGMGMIALRSGVPVVPVAIWGSEKIFKSFRPRVTIVYGQPIVLKPKGSKITREDIDEATNTVMRKIAEMLPPEYRGVYGP